MREAVIVSYARTGLAKAARGGFNNTSNMAILGHAVEHAVKRSGVAPADVEDVVAGCGAASGKPVNRACSSGLNAIANAARYVIDDGAQIVVGAGVDSITFQGGGGGGKEPKIVEMYPDYWMPMIDTADVVSKRYNISREYQDEYSLESQKRMAAAQQAGKFKDEIVPMATKMKVVNKDTKEESLVDYVVTKDECN